MRHPATIELQRAAASRGAASTPGRWPELLASAGGALWSCLDAEGAVLAVARVAAGAFADWVVADLLDPGGALRRVAVEHPEGAAPIAIGAVMRLRPGARSRAWHALDSGKAQLLADPVPDLDWGVPQGSDAAPPSAPLTAVASAVVAPLLGRDRRYGTLTFLRAPPAAAFDEAERGTAEELGRLTGLALDNARLHAAEQGARADAERAASGLARLHGVTLALSRMQEPLDVARAMVVAAAGAVGAERGAVWVRRADGGLRLLHQEGYPVDWAVSRGEVAPDEAGPVAEVLARDGAVHVTSPEDLVRRYPAYFARRAPVSRAAVLLPLRWAGAAQGVLLLGFDRPRSLGADEEALVDAIAAQCALALERGQLYAALLRERSLLGAVVRQLPAGVVMAEPGGRIVLANEASSRILGRSVAPEKDGDPPPPIHAYHLDGSRWEPERLPLARALAEGARVEGEPMLVSRADGRLATVSVSAAPVHDAAGGLIAAVASFVDVTEERAARERLAQANETLHAVIDASPLAVVLLSLEGRVVIWNPAAERLFGWREPEVVGGMLPIVPPERADEFRRHLRDVDAGRVISVETTRRTRAGRTVQVALWAVALPTPEGRRCLWILEDIGERLRTRRALADVAERSRALAETSKALSSVRLEQAELLRVLARSAAAFPGDAGAVLLLDDGGDSLRAAAVAHHDPALDPALVGLGGQPMRLTPALRRALDRMSPLVAGADSALARQVLAWPELAPYAAARGLASLVAAPMRGDGRVLGVLVAWRDAGGTPHASEDAHYLGELADRAALALTNARLYEEARAAVRVREEFLSIAGHELRTPLTALELVLHGATRQARRPGAGPAIVAERLERAVHELDRMKRLSDQLLDVSRITEGRLELQPEATDLVAVARDVVARHADVASAARCEVTVAAEAPVVGWWDRARIEQVFVNLLSNAVKYGGGKPIEVRVGRSGERAWASVTDHGLGIAVEDQARIFQRFERAVSARHFGGLGLGLWIARQIVEAHGGVVGVSSEPGRGSVFRFELPCRCTEGGPA